MCDDDERYVANEAYISGLSLSPHMHRTLYYEQMDKNENECCSKCASCSNIITPTYSYTGILPVPLLLLRPLLSRFFFRLHIHSRVSGPLLLLSEMYELIWWWFDGAIKKHAYRQTQIVWWLNVRILFCSLVRQCEGWTNSSFLRI